GQGFVVDARETGGTTGGLAIARDHREHRLADEVHRVGGEDGVVVHDRPAVVAPGDVGGDEHAEHTGRGEHGGEIHRHDAGVRVGGQAERRVRGAGGLGEVVDVGGLAGH